jgi:hypothetical protein
MAEFGELNQGLANHLSEVTLRVIREEAHADASEAAELPQALPPGSTATE